MTRARSASRRVGAMTDALPLFVYGSLRSGQLAHHQIADLVEQPEPARIHGYGLWVRDGLPLLRPQRGETVWGEVLRPAAGKEATLSERVRQYEGDDLYTKTIETVEMVGGQAVEAHVFVGRRGERGRPEAMVHGDWSAQTDPLLTLGLDAITRASENLLPAARVSASDIGPVESEQFWQSFVPLQGLYLVLCTVLERYTALVYGPALDPMERLRRLRDDTDAIDAAAKADPPRVDAVDSRNATNPRSTAGRPFEAWYLVRSNLTHRGKGGYHDYELIMNALIGLHDALRYLLAAKLPQLAATGFASPDRLLSRHRIRS